MTMTEKIHSISSTLPPQALAQLLDFAEFLQLKSRPTSNVPPMPLSALAGGLEQSATFVASPMSIQESLRREWD